MKKTITSILLLVLLMGCAKKPQSGDFIGKVKILSPTGDSLFSEIAVRGDVYRLDFKDDTSYLIVNKNKGISYNVFPEDSTYTVLSPENPFFDPIRSWENSVVQLIPKFMGDTIIDGISTKHFAYGDKRGKVFEKWEGVELDFPILQIFFAEGKKGVMHISDIQGNTKDDAFFAVPEGFQQTKSPMDQLREQLNLEMTGPAVDNAMEFEFPFGFRIAEGAVITVPLSPNWKESVLLANYIPDTAVVEMKVLKMKHVISTNEIVLPTRGTSVSPEFPDEATSAIFTVKAGRAKLHGERERKGNAEDPIERDYYLGSGKRTFWMNPSRAAEIVISGDSQDASLSRGVYRVTGKEGTQEEEFQLKNGEIKKINLPLEFGSKSLICGIEKGGGIVIKIRQ